MNANNHQSLSAQARVKPIIRPEHIGFLAIIVCVIVGGIALTAPWPFMLIPFGLILGGVFVTLSIKYPMFIYSVYMIIFLFRPQEMYPQLYLIPFEKILIVILAVSYIINSPTKIKNFKFYDLDWAFIFFIVAVFLSIMGAEDLYRAKNQFISLINLFIMYLFTVRIIKSEKKLKFIIWIYAASMIYVAINSTIGYYSGDFEVRQGIQRAHNVAGPLAAYADPNSMAASLMLCLPFIIVLFRDSKSTIVKLVLLASVMLCIWTVIITGSRSGMLTTIIALLILALHTKYKFATIIGALIVIAAFSVLMPDQYVSRFQTIFTAFDEENDETGAGASARGRINGLLLGIQFCMEHPLTGVGVGNFAKQHRLQQGGDYTDAHNLLGKILGELGLIGLFTYIYFIVKYIKNLRLVKFKFKKFAENPSPFMYNLRDAIKVGLIMLFVTGLFGHNLYRYNWFMFASFMMVISNILDTYSQQINQKAKSADKSLPDQASIPA